MATFVTHLLCEVVIDGKVRFAPYCVRCVFLLCEVFIPTPTVWGVYFHHARPTKGVYFHHARPAIFSSCSTYNIFIMLDLQKVFIFIMLDLQL